MSEGLAQVMTGVALTYKFPLTVAKSWVLSSAFTVKDVVPGDVDEVVVIVNSDVFETSFLDVNIKGFGEKEAVAPAGKVGVIERLALKSALEFTRCMVIV